MAVSESCYFYSGMLTRGGKEKRQILDGTILEKIHFLKKGIVFKHVHTFLIAQAPLCRPSLVSPHSCFSNPLITAFNVHPRSLCKQIIKKINESI